MIIVSEDNKRTVNVGGEDIWVAVYSTVENNLGMFKRKVPLAMKFLASGKCDAQDCLDTARQINLIRDKLSQVSPEKAVYDLNNPKKKAPWHNNLSPVVTSCANMFTTADGQDLLFEIVSILSYGYIKKMFVGRIE